MKAQLYTDGGSRGNPGPAAAGILIIDENKKEIKAGKYLGHATNNEAEYNALILGLQKCSSIGVSELECFMDSELVIKQMQGLYKVKDSRMQALFALASDLKNRFDTISFTHIERAKNKTADQIVNYVLDKNVKL